MIAAGTGYPHQQTHNKPNKMEALGLHQVQDGALVVFTLGTLLHRVLGANWKEHLHTLTRCKVACTSYFPQSQV